MLGGVIILLLIGISLFADALAPYPYNKIHLRDRMQEASGQYLLGTDHVGRDLLSRLIHGARISLGVGLAATTLNVLVALLVGGVSGFLGGKLDLAMQRLVDAWIAFPGLLLLLTIMSIVGQGLLQIILVLGIAGGVEGSRVVRGAVIAIKENDYFLAAKALGSPLPTTLRTACAAQYHAAPHHHLLHQHWCRHHVRGGAELPRLRAAPEHSQLGRHAQSGRTALHGDGPLAGALAWAMPDNGRFQSQHVRRRPARSARSPAAGR